MFQFAVLRTTPVHVLTKRKLIVILYTHTLTFFPVRIHTNHDWVKRIYNVHVLVERLTALMTYTHKLLLFNGKY